MIKKRSTVGTLCAALLCVGLLSPLTTYADPVKAGDGYVDDGAVMITEDVGFEEKGASIDTKTYGSGLDKGMLGFFESRGSSEAVSVIGWGANTEGSTTVNGAYDATRIDLALKALDYIDECNALRAKHGLDALMVTDYMMATAEVQLNWSDTNTQHSHYYNVDENHAWSTTEA